MKILHIDDEPDIREITALSLGIDPDIELTSCPSGRTALDALEGGLRPDAILLDVMMPGLDGPGTLLQVRTIAGLTETPVIFMTARAQAQEQARFIGLGAIGVIIKPFDPMTLAGQVRDILAAAGPKVPRR
ncbi:MAG TPA: response regulator [Brevundimonas sp.]|jgi:CheY-like chemotaxis protein